MSENEKLLPTKGVWSCTKCSNVELKEREVICWKCGVGEMVYREIMFLWKNFVDIRQEYWAFSREFPSDNSGNPLVVGEPCGYAILKDSRIISELKSPTKVSLEKCAEAVTACAENDCEVDNYHIEVARIVAKAVLDVVKEASGVDYE